MNKKTIIVIVAIIATVSVAVAAYTLTNHDNGKDYSNTEIGEIGTYVPIYGNANGDLYINDDDVDMIEYLIKQIAENGETAWDSAKAPYADANCDGKITEKDVELVKKIINVESCEVFYEDYFGDVTAVNFPLTNRNIAVTYYQQAEACAILGVLDDVTVASMAATVYGTMWPTLDDAVVWGTTGSSAITDDAVEKFIANDVTLVICTPRTENQELAQRLHEERNIDFIQLWYNGNYCISTIQTMGILMDCQDKSQAYMDYCNGVIDKLTSTITNKDSTRLMVINGYSTTNDRLTVMANERHGSYVLINKYLGNCYYEDGTNQFGFVYHNIEWLVENGQDVDAIVFCMSGNSGYSDDQSTGTYYTADAYNEKFETEVSYFTQVNAYKTGEIIGSVYANMFGFSAYAVLELIAAQLYPDLFTLNEATATLQDWFDNYDVVDIDVTEQGPISYTGTAYETSYPQLSMSTSNNCGNSVEENTVSGCEMTAIDETPETAVPDCSKIDGCTGTETVENPGNKP
ncbi:MAG: dockerin type I domain-containing protein [Methanomethylophilus sp.]